MNEDFLAALPEPFETYKKQIFGGASTWGEKCQKGISMLSEDRMNNVYHTVKSIIDNKIPGDFVETGVWRGGASIFAALILKHFNETKRNVWVCDSFEGFPENKENDEINWSSLNSWIKASQEDVIKNFEKFDVLGTNIKFVKGFFADTMKTIEVKEIAVLRLDGDMYNSTMDCLNALYPKLNQGGFCIIDDYCPEIPECIRAVNDYRDKHGIIESLIHFPEEPDDLCPGTFWQVSKKA